MFVVWVLPSLMEGALSGKDEMHSLGILMDPALSTECQIAFVVRSVYFHLRQIAHLCPYLDTGSLTTLVLAMIVSRLDYCNALYVELPLRLETSAGPELSGQIEWDKET